MAVQSMPAPRRNPLYAALDRVPWWLLAAILIGLLLLWAILTDEDYTVIFIAVSRGLWTTIWVTVVSYIGAVLVGLVVALLRISKSRFLREASTFYVEIVRGVPVLVLLFYIAFVGAPWFVSLVNSVGAWLSAVGLGLLGAPLEGLGVRDVGFAARSVLALIVAYSAFISEIFRAGIESIERGQREAALSLGMSRWQTLRHVVLPQAVRRVLPPLGNDFIAMLKDSSLVSVLGVQDITNMGRVYAASTFLFFETYNVVAFLYLIMTLALTLFVRWLERRLPQTT